MRVLTVGAAGHVGGIIRPALERQHETFYFDRRPIPGCERPLTVASVNDQPAVESAVAGMDAVIYLAMGVVLDATGTPRHNDIAAAFDVNAQGLYRFLSAGLAAGVRRVVYASSLSVYSPRILDPAITEDTPATAWGPYGLTKRVGEFLCQAAAQRYPDATVISLRLFAPRSDAQWRGVENEVRGENFPLGPQDTRALFLAALACPTPGGHILQAAGDVPGRCFPSTDAQRLVGWRPRGA